MGYEDIEPPLPEVDKLYKAIVADYKVGKYSSQEEALSILESQYFFSFIEIKDELHGEFEAHPYYIYGEMGSLDEYIKVCEKSENSPTPTEQEIYIKMLDGLIRKVQTVAITTDNLKYIKSYDDAAKFVYRQVERVRKLCRKNRENEELYQRFKTEMEGMQPQNDEVQLEKANNSDFEQSFFIQTLKNKSLPAYKAMKKAIETDLVEYNDKWFNFRCSKGSVALLFGETGYKDYKTIRQFVLVNNDPCEHSTLKNWKTNPPPDDWLEVQRIILGVRLK
jgi:hypothetical protein